MTQVLKIVTIIRMILHPLFWVGVIYNGMYREGLVYCYKNFRLDGDVIL